MITRGLKGSPREQYFLDSDYKVPTWSGTAEYVQCLWRSNEDHCRKSDHSIESRFVIDKILSQL